MINIGYKPINNVLIVCEERLISGYNIILVAFWVRNQYGITTWEKIKRWF